MICRDTKSSLSRYFYFLQFNVIGALFQVEALEIH